MKEKALKKEEELLECEKLWIFAVMIAVGGFLCSKGRRVLQRADGELRAHGGSARARELAQGAVLSPARFGLSARHGHFGIFAQAYKPP